MLLALNFSCSKLEEIDSRSQDAGQDDATGQDSVFVQMDLRFADVLETTNPKDTKALALQDPGRDPRALALDAAPAAYAGLVSCEGIVDQAFDQNKVSIVLKKG